MSLNSTGLFSFIDQLLVEERLSFDTVRCPLRHSIKDNFQFHHRNQTGLIPSIAQDRDFVISIDLLYTRSNKQKEKRLDEMMTSKATQ